MSYLSKSKIEPKGTTVVHPTLFIPYMAFVMNDGYIPENRGKTKQATFYKDGKPVLTISKTGDMNEHAQSRYRVFLKEYLKHGAKFIAKLNAQIKIVEKSKQLYNAA